MKAMRKNYDQASYNPTHFHKIIIKYYNSIDGVTNVNFSTNNMVRPNTWKKENQINLSITITINKT